MLDYKDYQERQLIESSQKKRACKKQLAVGMAIKEEKKESERLREAYIDEKNKPGPPMMIEIEANQNQVEENTR